MNLHPRNRFGLPAWAARSMMTLAALAGGWAMTRLGVPAGWLSGSMIVTAGLAAFGLAEPLTAPFRWIALTLSGLVIGSAATPDVLGSIGGYPASILLMLCAIALSTWASLQILRRLPGWSAQTALLASIPGALSYVMALAAVDRRVDIRRVAVVQVLRVFLLMGLAPLVLVESGATLAALPASLPTASFTAYLALVPMAALIGFVFEKLRVAAGLLFGGMLVSGLAYGFSLVHGRPPAAAAIGAQVFLGLWIGARFVGFDWAMMARSAAAALGSFVLAMAISCAGAWLAHAFLGVQFGQALIAYAPGGLEAMTLLAFALGMDPLFIAAHHLARFAGISAALPLVKRWRDGSE